jgi:WD40 repeat protein
MTSQQEITYASLHFYKSQPFPAVPEAFYLTKLGLKWQISIDQQHDSLQFIKRNKHDTFMCVASSKPYLDLAADIWDLEERSIIQHISSPGTQISCMDWLSSDAFLTGGHDNTLSMWSEGVRRGQ